MRKLLVTLTVVASAALLSVGAASARSQSGGATIVSDGYSPDFSPASVLVGSGVSTTLTITVNQPGREGRYALIILRNLNAAGLTFVANGDHSASCGSTTLFGGIAWCEYSDFAHSYKSDSFTFTTDPHQAAGAYSVNDEVVVAGVGEDSATSTITYSNLPPAYVAPPSGALLCYSVGGALYATTDSAQTNSLLEAGYWVPSAVGFNSSGKPELACLTPSQNTGWQHGNAPLASEYTDNNGDRITADAATPTNYPIVTN